MAFYVQLLLDHSKPQVPNSSGKAGQLAKECTGVQVAQVPDLV